MNIGEKISKLRKENGLSQEAFAEMLGVSRQSVSKWESGTATPDIDKIVAMSKIFNISTDSLLKEDEQAEKPFSSEADTAPFEPVTAEQISEKPTHKKGGKKPVIKIVAAILALCIVITAIALPVRYGGIREAWWEICGGKVQYPYVLVHGLGGWGEGDGINDTVQYWGATACNLTEQLTENGYEVYAPSVGPFSSAWDRACELYAQLTGTTVDYGEAHSKHHNHARYGEKFTQPLFEGWGTKINGGQRIKINLVGHSFGGATVRLLASLLEYGSEAEIEESGKDVSPLFEGGKGNWVNSVTALCAPHNGSSLTCILDGIGGLVGVDSITELLVDLCFNLSGVTSSASGVYDFNLGHFGVDEINGDKSDIEDAVSGLIDSGTDNAVYDLSPDGAAELNGIIQTVPDVYYFSYAYSTTREASFLSGYKPNLSTLPILLPVALAMGNYKGTTDGGIEIGEEWQDNDGLVNVISARYPFDEEYVEINDGEETEYERGVWYVAPTREGDHGTVIGLNAEEKPTIDFFVELLELTDSLKR